jgi:hypothetical protein
VAIHNDLKAIASFFPLYIIIVIRKTFICLYVIRLCVGLSVFPSRFYRPNTISEKNCEYNFKPCSQSLLSSVVIQSYYRTQPIGEKN